jgi:phosphinothricin acetyltransferase
MAEIIRIASPADADTIAAIYTPYVRDTVISFELEPPHPEEMGRRMSDTLAILPWLVVERDGQILAYAYAGPHRSRWAYQWSVDVSVYVDAQAHRRGYGRRLYHTLLGILRVQGYYTAYAGITLPNEASVGLHEAMGFRPIGVYHNVGYKMGRWWDVGWWGLPLRDYDPSPAPPRRFTELAESADLEQLLAGQAV